MAQRLALIIGNSVYRDETLSRLLTPDVDVGDLADLLLDNEIGNFDDVKVLANMSFGAVRSAISDFYAGKKRDDLLLLYFSGHGVLDDRGWLYLAVKDTNTKLLRDRAISAQFITDEMNNSRSQRQVLILDCCHSGAFERGTKGQTGASVGTSAAFEGTGYGRVVMTASDATQYAWEGNQVIGKADNSLFTHYLVQGLKSGEADVNSDGKITVDELFDYVYEKVVRQTPKQTPGKWSYKERGEIIIALHRIETTKLEVDLQSPDTESKLNNELERNLEKLYLRGATAYHLEDWEKAANDFKAIAELRANYRDTSVKLAESERQVKLANLYNNMEVSLEENDWQSALAALEEMNALEPLYKDIAIRIEGLRTQKRLFDLYNEAQQLFMDERWNAIINIFTKIEAIQPDYPDAYGIKEIASKKVGEIERQELLNDLYKRSLIEIEAKRWHEANQLLVQIQNVRPGYEETERLITKVEDEISKQVAETKVGGEVEIKPEVSLKAQLDLSIVKDDLNQHVEKEDDRMIPVSVSPALAAGIKTFRWPIWLRGFALITPGAILFIFLQGLPLLGTLWISFQHYFPGSTPNFVGFSNYSRIFSDSSIRLLENSIGLLFIRCVTVLIVWLLLRASWRRMHLVPAWLVLTAVAPLPFLFSLGNTISWIVFGSNGPFGLLLDYPFEARLFVLVIDGLNTFAVSSAVGLLIYALVQRVHNPGSQPGIAILKLMRNIMLIISSASALQAFTPGLISSRFIEVPLTRMYQYQTRLLNFGAGAAISSILIVALVFCAWLLWRTLKATSLKLVEIKESEHSGQNRSRVNLLLLLLGILPGIIILLPYLSLWITAGLNPGLYTCRVPKLCEWSWSSWFLNNLLFPGLAVWIVQLPVAFLTGYAIALKRLPGRHTKRILTGLFLFSGIVGTAVISGILFIIFFQWNQMGSTWTSTFPLFFSGFGVIVFMNFMEGMAEQVNRAKEDGKSEWYILRYEILPWAKPLILLMGVTSTYWASQHYYWSLLASREVHQWPVGVYLYNALSYLLTAPTIVQKSVYPLAIPCAAAIILLVRTLLQRVGIATNIESGT